MKKLLKKLRSLFHKKKASKDFLAFYKQAFEAGQITAQEYARVKEAKQ